MQRNLNLSFSVTNLAMSGIEPDDRDFYVSSVFSQERCLGAEIVDRTLRVELCITEAEAFAERLLLAIADTKRMLKAGLRVV